jgi:hypothetical protein
LRFLFYFFFAFYVHFTDAQLNIYIVAVREKFFEQVLIQIRYSQGCGKPGHWMRDGLCKPEDVAAKVARDYAAFQASQQAASGQEQALSPPGMIYRYRS